MVLATPFTLLMILTYDLSDRFFPTHYMHHNLKYTLPAAICLYLAQIFCTSFFIFRTQTIVMQTESNVCIKVGWLTLAPQQTIFYFVGPLIEMHYDICSISVLPLVIVILVITVFIFVLCLVFHLTLSNVVFNSSCSGYLVITVDF